VDLSVEEILRRLLLLGLPLVPLACSEGPPLKPEVGLTGTAGTGGSSGGTAGGSGGIGGGSGGSAGTAGTTPVPPTGCTVPGCGCGSSPSTPFDKTVTVSASTPRVTQDALTMCSTASDCTFLCTEVATPNLFTLAYVTTCERVWGDGGVDGGDAGSADADADDGDGSTAPITLHIVGTTHYDCTGRRPANLERMCVRARGTAAGRWLAGAAALEAASVPAFRQLARELAAHGAPAHLVAAANAAVAEEKRHYALMARAARARGAEPRRPRVGPTPVRTLLEVARENAREGCVRETFGAMTAAFQSRHARDAELRTLMASIARDEAGHARLAWEIDVWARAALPRHEARQVDEARRAEGAELASRVDRAPMPRAVRRTLGLPAPATERRQARRAQQALWS
jgi:hypothetical protein